MEDTGQLYKSQNIKVVALMFILYLLLLVHLNQVKVLE